MNRARSDEESSVTPPPPTPPSSSCCSLPKNVREWIDWMKCLAWTCLAVFLLMFAAAGIMHFLKMQSSSSRLHCYECISITGTDAGEPGLPIEAKCETAPKNWRICKIGEVCSTGQIEGGGMKRFQRSCSSEYNKIGCSPLEKTVFGTQEMYCVCNKDYCK